ncbi:rhodanese-related sulfurtransferase [Terrimicrobium sacchariphilum]|uniref:Rhodanese-related sulfurtransferase n=1 Tax=Terrimicrobium sacchariphilum TaxID=690879 RepID=A0A146G0Q0_TERSA|nr:rhodanese-like domain-containing protein [Terrimicrobium sacchariphilum]GAT31465.1 rhodanese-related sulfurtransferase [Terrimicrobium sacchariphilum]
MSTVLPTAVLSPREVHDQIQTENPLVVDVREPAEYAAGRIPSAQIIPLSELRQVSQQWKRETPIILYCQNGARSEQARIFMALRGFTNHRSMKGGYLAWKNAGYPVEASERAPWSFDRQAKVAIGLALAGFTAAGLAISPAFLAVDFAIAAALITFALTAPRWPAQLLSRLPWNRVHHS